MQIQITNRLGILMAEYSRRTKRRLTQKMLEAETGIAQSTISSYVNNDVTLYSDGTLRRLCEFFHCGIDDLLVAEWVNEYEQPEPNDERAAV